MDRSIKKHGEIENTGDFVGEKQSPPARLQATTPSSMLLQKTGHRSRHVRTSRGQSHHDNDEFVGGRRARHLQRRGIVSFGQPVGHGIGNHARRWRQGRMIVVVVVVHGIGLLHTVAFMDIVYAAFS
jgi:hypothetical protein